MGWDFFDVMVKDHINQYNYTLNPQGIFNSIKFMYTYYPDPNNKTHIREEFVRVRKFELILKRYTYINLIKYNAQGVKCSKII